MKKLVSVILGLIFVVPVAAAETGLGTIQSPVDNDLLAIIGNITSYVRPLIAVVFLFVIIYGGFTRMTAAGDAEKEKKSNAILTAGVVGFVIIVLAPVIVSLIASVIGVRGGLF